MKKEYAKDDLVVVWRPELCIHAGVCFRTLPEVFRPRERPWIQLDKSEKDRIISTVQACPTSAISLKTNRPPDMLSIEASSPEALKVNVITDGPVRVVGPCTVTMADGTVLEKPKGVSLCRCGQSATKPFCDGSHKTNGFSG